MIVRQCLIGAATLLGSACPALVNAAVATPVDEAAGPAEVTQPERSSTGSEVADIIVTAEKREAKAQNTPIALAVIGADLLNLRQVQGIEALSGITPNLRYYETVQQAFITIRGVGGERNTTPAGDPSVALHIDGVYQARNNAGADLFYDVSRVEVLRGPQGTLYGRNATGGAINIISNAPDLSRTSVAADALIGNYDRRRLRGVVNVPIVSDRLAFRVSGVYEKRHGFIRNLSYPDGSNDFQDADVWNVKGQLKWAAGPDTTLTLRGFYGEANAVGSTDEAVTPFGNPALTAPATAGGYGALPEPEAPFLTRQDVRQFARSRNRGVNSTLDVGGIDLPVLGAANWTTIVAWQRNRVSNRSDPDRTAARFQSLDTSFDNKQFSAETRLTSTGARTVDWQVGAFFIRENDSAAPSLITFLPNGATAATSDIRMDVEATSYAFFSQATWHLSPQLRLTGGLRYTHDSKDVVQSFAIRSLLLPTPINVTVPGKGSWSAVTGKVGLEADLARDSLLFANVTRGYKAGGFGLNQPQYNPEYIWAYEIGSKNRFLDHKLQANISLFYYRQRDQQVGVYSDGFLPGAPSILVQNAGRSRTYGAELEIEATPVRNLAINASLSYLDAKYASYSSVDPYDPIKRTAPGCAALPAGTPVRAIPATCLNTVVLDGKSQPLAPRWSGSIGVQYKIDLGRHGSISPRADATWTSSYLLRAYGQPGDRQGSYPNVDLALRWRSENEAVSVEAFVKNLTDEAVAAAGSYLTAARAIGVTYLPPRTFGGSVGVKF